MALGGGLWDGCLVLRACVCDQRSLSSLVYSLYPLSVTSSFFKINGIIKEIPDLSVILSLARIYHQVLDPQVKSSVSRVQILQEAIPVLPRHNLCPRFFFFFFITLVFTLLRKVLLL